MLLDNKIARLSFSMAMCSIGLAIVLEDIIDDHYNESTITQAYVVKVKDLQILALKAEMIKRYITKRDHRHAIC